MPPSLNIVHVDNVAPTRWRNGGGWTRELLAWPSATEWIVRISVADIEADGPFSAFPGVDRCFAVLDGQGVELNDGSETLRLRQGDAVHRFRGEAAPACRLLGGPTRDFNLMVQRDRATAVVGALPGSEALTSDWSGCFATAPLRVRCAGDEAWVELPARALAWTAAPARLQIDERDGRGWRIAVTLAEARDR